MYKAVGLFVLTVASALAAARGQVAPDLAERLLAARSLEAAQQLLDKAPENVSEALFEAIRKSAQTKLDQRQHASALLEWQIALEIGQRLQSPLDLATAYRGAGLSYYRVDKAAEALANYNKGIAQAERSGARKLLAELLRGAGAAHRSLGDYAQAVAADERSIELFKALGETRLEAYGLNNLGINYHQMGEIRRSENAYKAALDVGKAYPDVVSFVKFNLGGTAAEQGNIDSARFYFEQALHDAEAQKDKQGIAKALINLGPIYCRYGRFDEALAGYKRAYQLAREGDDVRLETAILVNRAHVYTVRKQYDLSVADLRAVVKFAESGQVMATVSRALSNLAQIEAATGRTADACEHAERALGIGLPYDTPEVLWQAYDAVAACELSRNRRVEARKALESSIDQVEGWRLRVGGSDSDGARFLDGKLVPYYGLLSLLVEDGEGEAALRTAERAKARQLLDVIRLGKAELTAALTAKERARERELVAASSDWNRRLGEAVTPEQKAHAKAQWGAAIRELEAFYKELYLAHPGLAARRGEAIPITLSQTVELLPDARTMLVEFVATEEKLVIFAVDRPGGGAPRLLTRSVAVGRQDLQREVNAFQAQLSGRDLGYRRAASTLYRRLLGPLEQELKGKDSLVIVPDGPLWNLSFQALVAPDGHHMLEDYAISMAPSLTFLHENRRHRAGPADAPGILAMGDPTAARLPMAAKEVREVARLYGSSGGRALTGDDADKETWEREAPRYRILHIATHGVVNTQNPLYSYLELARKPGHGDNILEAREVLNMDLQADLAVLSACETARGAVAEGEGLIGMSWAFLLAGAPTTVVSQWKVDSASTTQLMLAFHRSLRAQPLARSRALQRAALRVMKTPEYRHPFYWAGFVMVGDGY